MKKQTALSVLVIKDEDIKVRKRHAPPTKVRQSHKLYDRKRDKRRLPDGDAPLLFIEGFPSRLSTAWRLPRSHNL